MTPTLTTGIDDQRSAILITQTRWLKRKLYYLKTRIRSVERGICPIAAVCTVLLSRSRDPGQANVSETFLRGHVATIPGSWNMPVKFEVRTFSRFGAISI